MGILCYDSSNINMINLSHISCEEVIGESGSKVYRAVIANVPENARIFYKFFKYSPYVIVNNQLRADWEWLDRNQFTVDSHNNVNRVLNIQNGVYWFMNKSILSMGRSFRILVDRYLGFCSLQIILPSF